MQRENENNDLKTKLQEIENKSEVILSVVNTNIYDIETGQKIDLLEHLGDRSFLEQDEKCLKLNSHYC